MAQPPIRYTKTSDAVGIAHDAIGHGPAMIQLPPIPATNMALEWQVGDLREVQERIAAAAAFSTGSKLRLLIR